MRISDWSSYVCSSDLPDAEIFGPNPRFRPATLYRIARSKAYLFKGVEIRWKVDPELLRDGDPTPAEAVLHFPGGLADFLASAIEGRPTAAARPVTGDVEVAEGPARLDSAVAWLPDQDEVSRGAGGEGGGGEVE